MPPTASQDVRIGDVTLAQQVLGDGEPILMIHGALIADALLPLAQAEALSSFRRITYHKRGYGDSSRVEPVPMTLAQNAQDALALADHDGVDSAHLVGHSSGALTALVLAAMRPERVRSLVLLEPPTAMSRPPGAEFMSQMQPLMQSYAAGDVTGAVSGFYDRIYQPGWRARMDRARPGAFEQSLHDAAMSFESELPGLDWNDGLRADQVAAVRCPVLSVLGTHTKPVFADTRQLLHDWFPWCRDADIDRGDHMLPLEYPDAVASAITAFLDRVRGDGPSRR